MEKANQNEKPPTGRRKAHSSNDSSTSEKQRSSRTIHLDGFNGHKDVSSQDDDTNKDLKLKKFKLSLGSNVSLKINVIDSSSGHIPEKDEDELRKEKRKQANRESAKRSRLRKQQEREQLEAIASTLNVEVSNLTEQLKTVLDGCATLNEEITSLTDELEKQYGPEVVSDLKVAKLDSCMMSEVDATRKTCQSTDA